MGEGGSYRVMHVQTVTVELPEQYPMVTLQEAESPRRALSFLVGMPEGAAIAAALRGLEPPRPLPHQLLATLLRRFGADIVAVRLTGRRGANYQAELELMAPRGGEVVPCRPSDGIILSLRQAVPAPLLADERLLDHDGDVEPPAAQPAST